MRPLVADWNPADPLSPTSPPQAYRLCGLSYLPFHHPIHLDADDPDVGPGRGAAPMRREVVRSREDPLRRRKRGLLLRGAVAADYLDLEWDEKRQLVQLERENGVYLPLLGERADAFRTGFGAQRGRDQRIPGG